MCFALHAISMTSQNQEISRDHRAGEYLPSSSLEKCQPNPNTRTLLNSRHRTRSRDIFQKPSTRFVSFRFVSSLPVPNLSLAHTDTHVERYFFFRTDKCKAKEEPPNLRTNERAKQQRALFPPPSLRRTPRLRRAKTQKNERPLDLHKVDPGGELDLGSDQAGEVGDHEGVL